MNEFRELNVAEMKGIEGGNHSSAFVDFIEAIVDAILAFIEAVFGGGSSSSSSSGGGFNINFRIF
jgi:hypothetical protein